MSTAQSDFLGIVIENTSVPLDFSVRRKPNKRHETYRMNHKRRGVALVMDLQSCTEYQEPVSTDSRQQDSSMLQKTFSKLGFEVMVRQNSSSLEIQNTLRSLGERDHSDADCLAVVLMSQGKYNQFLARDRFLDINTLWNLFGANKCPSLNDKPKIFITQITQTTNRPEESNGCKEPGVGEQANAGELETSFDFPDDSVDMNHTLIADPTLRLPSLSDFLVVQVEAPPSTSSSPSSFIRTLCQHLNSHGHKRDFMTLLTMINNQISRQNLPCSLADPARRSLRQRMAVFSCMRKVLQFHTKRKCRSSRDDDSSNCSSEENDQPHSIMMYDTD